MTGSFKFTQKSLPWIWFGFMGFVGGGENLPLC